MRHAQSVPPRFGVPDDDQRPLTPAGMEAAKSLAGRLTAYEPAAVLSSPQLRAVQTVTPAADALGLAVTTWSELREWESGPLPSADWEARYAHSWARPGSVHGAGESLDALTLRAGKALARMAEEYPDVTVLVGSHGTFLARALMAAGHAVDWAFWRSLPMPAVYEVMG
ncbi:2,3-bisphosphoglycerate-dependent phosphoglycerate mutase [Lentzea albidocapillata subsp. violacea]|uniref:2,3-bisphosphoglycerate-dependent phosphoglycerate mutase n=1 Tax=Lentzea albidocapillata subsp. violacea TaxID=128104 RepID=A0A1G9KPH6_9PSEU|nr:2,3-bisphosphoglycerate-dependent phosphoglycerate mutase [Lentzea albidocapillata subsp. violacea]